MPSASPRNKNTRARWPEIRARSFEGTVERPALIENLLSRDEQERLQRIATLIEYTRGGTTLFSEGEDATFLYFVDKGIVRTCRCAENGHRQILAFRLPGDVLGLPDGGRYATSAEVAGPSRIYRLPWQRMHQMLASEPHLQQIFLEKVAFDFRQAQARIMVLGQQNIYQRLASFILELLFHSEYFDPKASRLRLPVNRFDIADYLGTAPESAARAFARLEAEGLIKRVTSRTVDILDTEGLVEMQRGRRRGHNRPGNGAEH
ncbi:MAG TPA: Crp/Fnr family transcriptional regulator [Opitutaceae bacterium]|nr:Crp/Fnr family transcriptional regulator [Opitutaceae bacterium]